MTIYEAVKEIIFTGALTAWQSHTITILITSFLATLAAVVIRSWSESIINKEQIIKLQQHNIQLQQKNINTVKQTLDAVHHIVNDFIVHYRFIMRDVKKDGSVCKEALEILDSSIEEVVQRLKILVAIKEPDQKESYMVSHPENR